MTMLSTINRNVPCCRSVEMSPVEGIGRVHQSSYGVPDDSAARRASFCCMCFVTVQSHRTRAATCFALRGTPARVKPAGGADGADGTRTAGARGSVGAGSATGVHSRTCSPPAGERATSRISSAVGLQVRQRLILQDADVAA